MALPSLLPTGLSLPNPTLDRKNSIIFSNPNINPIKGWYLEINISQYSTVINLCIIKNEGVVELRLKVNNNFFIVQLSWFMSKICIGKIINIKNNWGIPQVGQSYIILVRHLILLIFLNEADVFEWNKYKLSMLILHFESTLCYTFQ